MFQIHLGLPPFFSIIFLILNLIFSLSIPSLLSANVDRRYETCASVINTTCGHTQIDYPFWFPNTMPEYCGHPDFKVNCTDESLTMEISNHTFSVVKIDYDAYVLTISNPSFINNPCPLSMTNSSLDLTLFNLASSSQNATLFYDCSSSSVDKDAPYGFTCPTSVYSVSTTSNLAFLATEQKWEQIFGGVCNVRVYNPVLKSSVLGLASNSSNITEVLKMGFDVKLKYDDKLCDSCQSSGGVCGYNYTLNQPVCFCIDGAYGGSCNDSQILLDHIQSPASSNVKIIVVITAVILATTALVVLLYVWRWKRRRNGRRRVAATEKTLLPQNMVESITNEGGLTLFTMKKLSIATNNFGEDNKLGQGGFGPVYKGKLEDSSEVAIKRLSKASGQGLQEFMNEVLVISKLQHRNLVKLLGCCAEGEEKILIYEYMPNMSLDSLLFDPLHAELLDWKKRYNIIVGICRGLLYLHRDSRLRIIHRDLKSSNVLLDANLNPKISDFGMARIFCDNQDQADTNRVVGTYGYMSPEYAMEGRFSEKSDVFSFGVLLLEIISGRRNGNFKDNQSLSLLEYAWRLWNEDDILSLIDPRLSDSRFHEEIMRCIQLGLLCVQEFPDDRPSIADILSMVDAELKDIPRPSQPGFILRKFLPRTELFENVSVNHVSITAPSGR